MSIFRRFVIPTWEIRLNKLNKLKLNKLIANVGITNLRNIGRLPLNPKCITARLSKLNSICQSWDQPNRLIRSLLNTSLSSSVPTLATTLVSSANLSTVLQIFSSISSIKTTNSTSPSTEPCGTPLRTISQPDTTPSINTLCLRPVSQLPTHLTISLLTLYRFILTISLVCDTLSDAFWKSES